MVTSVTVAGSGPKTPAAIPSDGITTWDHVNTSSRPHLPDSEPPTHRHGMGDGIGGGGWGDVNWGGIYVKILSKTVF